MKKKKLSILCTICIRGGSKSLKNKNIKIMNGKPLFFHTVEQAINAKIFDNIVISSDSKKIISIAKKKLKDIDLIKRPKSLAKDNSPKIPVIRHCLKTVEKRYKKNFDIIIDLDVTSPLRKVSDIKKSLSKFLKKKLDNLFSVCYSKINPYFNTVELYKGKIKYIKKNQSIITCRQNAPITYDINASIYIWSRKTLLNSNKLLNKETDFFLMPHERSIDIDTNLDFQIVSDIIRNR